ncbi:MAG: 3-deoxy-7-phosphoheptulonate synthase [Dehalococcoidia bacterium]|jgi:3-deoxy-7-phosphoheptulonate synthase|nr:3-deoxy-7-phosphoheptulonate synthase [Dehalococcoidia bacterium]MEE2925688.1 3-deoxy-7-phosphoheptulonate synthase [Chloroflexota bacterium]HIB13501.1 3-deoxy-7-phosphoheptulonate synthase [Dehalococcoidia bacterium]
MLPSATRDVHIESTEPLITPIDLVNKLPITPQIERTVISGRDQVRSILNGQDKRLMMIVGPCSIHNEEAALEYAQRLVDFSKKLSDRLLILMRVYFEKPRTTIGWKGYIYDPHLDGTLDIETGLHRARALLLKIGEIGMYAGTEFLDPVVPQYLAGLVTWSTIGARTTESQIHRQMASGLSMPVGFKNGTDGNAQIAVDAMVSARSPHGFLGLDHQGRTALIRTTGNPDGHIVLRGGNSGPNFGAVTIDQAQKQLKAAGVRSQLLVDCSHGNSSKDHTKQAKAFKDVVEQRVEGNTDIIGCMVESNLAPGKQDLGDDPSQLNYGVSITDACIGWKETEELLTWTHAKVGKAA